MSQSHNSLDHAAGDLLSGRFRLLRPLGSGAMGAVWLAEDTALEGELIACKLVSGTLAQDPRAVACLKREVLMTRRLHHPNIVVVHTFWEDTAAQTSFITMEYVPGQNLAQLLHDRRRCFTLAEALPWLAQICSALDYAHSRGVLHRDIKPANILLAEGGSIRLADFGIARTIDDIRNRFAGNDACGTVIFMSPEQMLGQPVDHRSDLYSLAASVYELLSGAPPFSEGDILSQIEATPVQPIPHLPHQVNGVLLRALEKNPHDRFIFCGQFYQALAASADNAKTAAAPIADIKRDEQTVAIPRAGVPARLGKLLVDAGAISQRQLQDALEAQRESKERIGRILQRLGYVDEHALACALESQLHIPRVDLAHEAVNPAAFAAVDKEFARDARVFPIRITETATVVAMADPLDFSTINCLEQIFGSIEVCVALESDILRAIEDTMQDGRTHH